MKTKFILPILMLLVVCGFVVHGYTTISSVYTFIMEVLVSALATYIVIHTAAMNYKNEKKDMERYMFLSITLTVFFRMVQLVAILIVCVAFYAMNDGGELFKQTCDSIIIGGVACMFIVYVAVWHIHHLGTVRPWYSYTTNY